LWHASFRRHRALLLHSGVPFAVRLCPSSSIMPLRANAKESCLNLAAVPSSYLSSNKRPYALLPTLHRSLAPHESRRLLRSRRYDPPDSYDEAYHYPKSLSELLRSRHHGHPESLGDSFESVRLSVPLSRKPMEAPSVRPPGGTQTRTTRRTTSSEP